MRRVFTSVLALIVSYGLVAASPIMAQPQDRWAGLVGNWNTEFAGKDGKPLATGHFAFHGGPNDGSQGRAGGLVRDTTAGYKSFPCEGSFVGVKLELQCGTYGFSNHFDHLTLTLSADGNTLRGTWTWAVRPTGEPDGLVRWRRARPIIDKVEVLSFDERERPDYAVIKRPWATGGAPVQLRVRVHGRDLPNWTDTYFWAWQDVSIDDPRFRIVPESVNTEALIGRWRQGYMDVIVAMEAGARPGQKTITVNGSRKTFEAIFSNYPDASKVVELRFVRKDGSQLREIGYGEPFHVEARFDVPPPEAERIVKLDWGGGATDIPVIKQKDAKVFRSGLLYLEAPTTSTETRPNR